MSHRHEQVVPGVEFSGPKYFLSNMYPCTVTVDGLEYGSSEHAFQAAKCLDPADANLVRMQADGFAAKRVARRVQRIRPDWDLVRVDVMYKVVRAKFAQHIELQDRLLETGGADLVEHNTWNDRFWGVCDGKGENNLGKILMRLRAEIRVARAQAEAAASWLE